MATSKETRVRVDGFSKIMHEDGVVDVLGAQLFRDTLAGAFHGVRVVDDPAQSFRCRTDRDRENGGRGLMTRWLTVGHSLTPAFSI